MVAIPVPAMFRRRRVVLLLLAILAVLIFWTHQPGSSFSMPSRGRSSGNDEKIPVWNRLEHFFVFGDSYAQSFFNPQGEQPSLSNPFGNPDNLNTSFLGGPRHPFYLTTTYNVTAFLTYNYASGGATVSRSIVAPQFPSVLTFDEQLNERYWPTHHTSVKWTPATTLFEIFFGINDVVNTFTAADLPTELDKLGKLDDVLAAWSDLVQQLLSAGARNILVNLIPPVQTAPLLGAPDRYQLARLITHYNRGIRAAVAGLRTRFAKTSIYVFDAHALMDSIYADHAQYRQTKELLNLTASCDAYKNNDALDMFLPECGVRLDQFLWWDNLHPTTGWHDLHAMKIVEDCFGALERGRGRAGFCAWS